MILGWFLFKEFHTGRDRSPGCAELLEHTPASRYTESTRKTRRCPYSCLPTSTAAPARRQRYKQRAHTPAVRQTCPAQAEGSSCQAADSPSDSAVNSC